MTCNRGQASASLQVETFGAIKGFHKQPFNRQVEILEQVQGKITKKSLKATYSLIVARPLFSTVTEDKAGMEPGEFVMANTVSKMLELAKVGTERFEGVVKPKVAALALELSEEGVITGGVTTQVVQNGVDWAGAIHVSRGGELSDDDDEDAPEDDDEEAAVEAPADVQAAAVADAQDGAEGMDTN
jgi:hypothetical protein